MLTKLRLGRPWSLRRRLTAAFASVVALVLAATGVVVYVQFRHYVDARTDADLAQRAGTLRELAADEFPPARVLALSGERRALVYDAAGRLVAATRALRGASLLSPGEVRAARRGFLVRTRAAPGTDDGVRLRAFVVDDDAVAVVAEGRDGREQELHKLAALLGLSLPAALLLASLTGFQVARAALLPVEAMRARAAALGAADVGGRLPEPGTADELDRLARTLNELLDRLHVAVERERRLVGDASHELRTPISVLRTRLDVALRGDPGEAGLRSAVVEARADAARLARLADDLLVLARADGGQLPLRPEPLDAQDVLDNLVVNALRHGAGDVELRARPAPEGSLALEVRDHGPGLAADVRDRAFERFSQADGARADGGSGLGLAIVRALARAQGGEAHVDGHPDGGARATVTLPLA